MAGRALIVEDEVELSELFTEILHRRGLDAVVLHEGAPAPAWIRDHAPDLVLLDLMLPDKSGYAVCEEVKLDRKTNLIPIVMVTARSAHQDMVKGLAVGANEYVTKPFTLDQLNAAIDRALAWRDELCRCGAKEEIHFELKSDACFLEELNHMLSSLFLYSGLPGDSIRQLTTAIREMGMNAIEWGHRKQGDLLVNITYRIDKDRVVIVIRDSGPGFNPARVPHAADPEDPVKHMEVRDALGLRVGGFGILMARGLVDDLQYNDAGNEVRLVKYFAPR
ncbi:MAG: response regulator with CheY-like receiver domain and winged-helix DNA-binding domain [Phycisphaerales bacterium]|nr:response regulator with CheY-like receiver domain and winged-helix DNA-binding domain [Phycisphaerales bacterium]